MPRSMILSVNKNVQPHIDPPKNTPIALRYYKTSLTSWKKNNSLRNDKTD